MGDTGYSVLGFGGGFAKGLANVMYRNKQQKREDERHRQDKQDQLNLALLPHVFDNASDISEVEPYLQNAFPDTFGAAGSKAKKGSKNKPSAMENIGRIFQHFRGPGAGINTPRGSDLPENGGITGTLPRGHAGSGDLGTAATSGGTFAPASATATAIAPALAANPVGQGGATAPASDLPRPPATMVIPGTGIPVEGTPAVSTPTGQPAAKSAVAGPRKTFLGVPIMTPEEKADRAALGKTASINSLVTAARKLFAEGGTKTLEEAFDLYGLYNSTAHLGSSGAPNQSISGTRNGKPAFGVFNKLTGKYNDPVTGEPMDDFLPGVSAGARNPMGVIGMQAAVALGFDSVPAAIEAGKHKEITAKIEELLNEQAKQRALGTGAGKFESPIGVTEAQTTGTQVGATSKDYAGQQVGKAADVEKLRTLDSMRASLQRVLKPQPVQGADGKPAVDPATGQPTNQAAHSVLSILPSEKELKGVAPNVVMAVRRRSNSPSGLIDEQGKSISNRVAMARLDTVVTDLVGAFAKVAQGQVGSQSEPDVKRAYDGLVALQGKLRDPFGGDTREAATARITEALRILDRVAKATPGQPVANPGGAPTGAGVRKVGPDPANPKAPYQDATGAWIIP